jgi:hypothetical protein
MTGLTVVDAHWRGPLRCPECRCVFSLMWYTLSRVPHPDEPLPFEVEAPRPPPLRDEDFQSPRLMVCQDCDPEAYPVLDPRVILETVLYVDYSVGDGVVNH